MRFATCVNDGPLLIGAEDRSQTLDYVRFGRFGFTNSVDRSSGHRRFLRFGKAWNQHDRYVTHRRVRLDRFKYAETPIVVSVQLSIDQYEIKIT